MNHDFTNRPTDAYHRRVRHVIIQNKIYANEPSRRAIMHEQGKVGTCKYKLRPMFGVFGTPRQQSKAL